MTVKEIKETFWHSQNKQINDAIMQIVKGFSCQDKCIRFGDPQMIFVVLFAFVILHFIS
jgi:hypothetical protein